VTVKRIESQPAFILHTRAYRDSSMIVEFLTADFGRVSGVIKGVRSSAKAAKQKRSASQPFIPLSISWSGKSDLKTIIQIEPRSAPLALKGTRLFSGFYINELLTRLLQPQDTHTQFYSLYEWALNGLLKEPLIDVVLRHFELQLLEYLGYGLELTVDVSSVSVISPDQYYRFYADKGLVLTAQDMSSSDVLYKGEDLLNIANGNYTPAVRRTAKNLCRQALRVHLGAKPLKSRELFL
jgi:DNA repair protein RecO (recombination protein O)